VLYQLHKSIGTTILLAAFARVSWRLTHRPAPGELRAIGCDVSMAAIHDLAEPNSRIVDPPGLAPLWDPTEQGA
jgi:hypothetical protein